ncbi:hypothetical protein K9U40_01400 [Xanthobacter autotrophicus]|uniref:hypothetical protein n=1 Tax=Xanthobacter TaxID=279 RepID=UPI0024AB81ED|nr:hypothetical protein [Xanthobacter autotrophicus]MDI4662998.1 hypothetical protein [Xanthobacter autotrophicus]
MSISTEFLSPLSALLGALVGGGASLIAAIYTHHGQDRLQRIAAEITKREIVYADFVMHATQLLVRAYTIDELTLSGDEQHLIGLITRMRFFAPPKVVDTAEAVLRAIVDISLKPSIELRQLATEALSKNLDPDPLVQFSLLCRADLDSVRRTMR